MLLLWRLDRRERETPWLLLGALLWGALIATGSAGVLNGLFGAGLMLYLVSSGVIDPQAVRRLREGDQEPDPETVLGGLLAVLAVPVLVAPLVEESLKGLAVLLIMWLLRAEFDDVRDGIRLRGLGRTGVQHLRVRAVPGPAVAADGRPGPLPRPAGAAPAVLRGQ